MSLPPANRLRIVGPTLKKLHLRLHKNSGWDKVHTYEKTNQFNHAFEGAIHLTKSLENGRVFVLKYTSVYRLLPAHELRKCFDLDDEGYVIPNEVRILKTHLESHNHPNLIHVFEVSKDSRKIGRYQIWQEYCSGGDLFDQMWNWVITKKTLTPEQLVLHVLCEFAEGLAWLHHGLRHVGGGKYMEDLSHKAMAPEAVAQINNDTETPHNEANCHMLWNIIKKNTTAVDIYASGQVMYLLTFGKSNVVPIGTETRTMQIHPTYQTTGLRLVILRCMAVDPEERAEMSFRERKGLLPAVDLIRKSRDRMIEEKGELGREEWLHPKEEKVVE